MVKPNMNNVHRMGYRFTSYVYGVQMDKTDGTGGDSRSAFSEEQIKKLAKGAGLDWAKVKKGLARFIPILEMVSRLTPNKYDDLAIEFLKQLIDNEQPPEPVAKTKNA